MRRAGKDDLRSYLSTRKLSELVQEIIEHLLISTPDNPIVAVVDYLFAAYPHNLGTRRLMDISTCLEDENVEETKNSEAVPAEIPSLSRKTPDVSLYLQSRLAMILPFQSLSRIEMRTCIEAFRYQVVEKGQTVVRAGEMFRAFWLVQDGVVAVFEDSLASYINITESAAGGLAPRRFAVNRRFVRDLSIGESFGEASLLHEVRSLHTYLARTTAHLWVLDRLAYQCILHASEEQSRATKTEMLRRVPVFSQLSQSGIAKVAELLQEITANNGQELVLPGREVSALLILTSGRCRISFGSQNSYEVTDGFACGEACLFAITGALHNYTLVATEDVALLSLDGQAFRDSCGSLEELTAKSLKHDKAHGTTPELQHRMNVEQT